MIYLARHGQTSFNAEGRYQGASDSALTLEGVEQAHRVGALLRALAGECSALTLWSSPLGRALQTAAIVQAEMDVTGKIVVDARLREVSLGSWDGLTTVDIEYLYPGVCNGATAFDWYFRSPDGESADQAEERLRSWLADVALREGCHVVVSHGLTGRLLRGLYAGLPRPEALMLDVPQDSVFRLHAGSVEQFHSA